MNDEFCERCGVHLSLHPYGDAFTYPEPWECQNANDMAELIEAFYGIVRR